MIQKIINRLSLTIQRLSGDKPFTIKLANACVELLRNTKSRELRNHVIKKHIKKTTNVSRIKEVFIENGNTLIQKTEFPKFIWTMWWQGEENAPVEILEREFSSINHKDNSSQSMDDNITNKRWVSFCLSGEKGNIVSRAMRAFLLDQIENNKVLPDYFIIDFGLDYLYDEFEEIREIIKSIPRYSSQEDIFWLRIHSKDSYNKDEWHNETEKNQIFKSSYKEDEIVKDSYFDYLVKRKL